MSTHEFRVTADRNVSLRLRYRDAYLVVDQNLGCLVQFDALSDSMSVAKQRLPTDSSEAMTIGRAHGWPTLVVATSMA